MSMIFFLAGLQGIPRELVEAAAIDGADGARRLWYITIPLLRPTFIYVLITGIIGAFQTFDTSYIVFSTVENVGGPLDSALFPVLYLYYRAFGRFQMGYASAIAWIIFGIIVLFSLINLRVGRANESDQA
jgi:multiple sugar transport system permease protein